METEISELGCSEPLETVNCVWHPSIPLQQRLAQKCYWCNREEEIGVTGHQSSKPLTSVSCSSGSWPGQVEHHENWF